MAQAGPNYETKLEVENLVGLSLSDNDVLKLKKFQNVEQKIYMSP